MRGNWVRTIVLWALALGAGGAAAQAAEPLKRYTIGGDYAFEVRWSLFPELVLASGEANMVNIEEGYEMRLSAKANLAFPRINWKGSFAVRGEGPLGEGRPLRFERRSERPELTTAVVVKWNGQGEPPTTDTFVRPAGYQVKREPVDPSRIVNVIDPLSFMAAILQRVRESDGASCDITMNTWDGSRLAKIEIATLETVRAARTDCTVSYKDLSGLRENSPWRAEEQTTTRVLRFVRRGLNWEPDFLEISGVFLGNKSTFTTTIEPISTR